MSLTEHNREVTADCDPTLEEKTGAICILLRDGRLFGPFTSRQGAMYWCSAQDLAGFSTYDLLSPGAEP